MGKVAYHIEKGTGNAGGLGHHIDRTEGKEFSYKDADLSRVHLNQNYKLNKFCSMPLEKAIEERIKEGYKSNRKIRENTIRYTSHILSSDEKSMKEIFSKGQGDEWVKANLAFLSAEYGEKNIVRFSLHMDETTPHLHAIVVPLTPDGRLSAKEVIGNRKDLQDKQTRYSEYMKPFGLERGVLGSKATHENIQDYRRRINEAEQLIQAPDSEIKSVLGVVKASDVKSIHEENKALKTLVIDSRAEAEAKRKAFEKTIAIEVKEKEQLARMLKNEKEKAAKNIQLMEKVLTDKAYRKEIFTERLLKAEQNIIKDLKELSKKSIVDVTDIDDSIRKHATKVNENENVWTLSRKYYPKEKGDMESNLFNLSLKLNEEREQKTSIQKNRGFKI